MNSYQFEHLLLRSNRHRYRTIAGIDEVGRGALFGPVVAATVVVSRSTLSQLAELGVKDSKQLSTKRRSQLALAIKSTVISWQISYATVAEIDRLNILQASLLAMKRSVVKLKIEPDICLVDGKQPLLDLPFPQKTLVNGDCQSRAIAAASIIAKVWRDELIVRWATRYPHYDLAANKGYGTPIHRLAIAKYGITRQHRLSFSPCRLAKRNFY